MSDKVVNLREVVGEHYGKFWKARQRYVVLVGSRSSKKSTTTSLRFIVNMMKYPGANLLVVRKIYKDHKDSTYAQLKWAIKQLDVQAFWDVKLAPLELVYRPTGQKIMFRGLDDPMSITSITVETGYLCWTWFEEFFQVANQADFDMVDGSIRGSVPEPLFKQIVGTLNPWNEKHWIKRRFFDAPHEDVFTMQSDYTMNEFLDDADRKFFEEMRKSNPRRYQVEGLGNWGIAEGLVYDNWEEKDFDVAKIVEMNPHIKSGFGLDFGYTADPTAYMGALVDEIKKEIWIFEEHYEKGMLNNAIANMIQYKGRAKEMIVADCAEPKSIDEIKALGISRIKPARKGKDSVLNGIQFIRQFKIYVHPTCSNTILEFNNYAFETKDGKLINNPIDAYNHLMDALRYLMERFLVKSQIWLLSEKKV